MKVAAEERIISTSRFVAVFVSLGTRLGASELADAVKAERTVLAVMAKLRVPDLVVAGDRCPTSSMCWLLSCATSARFQNRAG
eukprot:9694942-Prorocentrum_lima.AAC.1